MPVCELPTSTLFINEQEEAKVLARDEQSSFLTKHLKSYGGTGEYEGYKIGRALLQHIFFRKGFGRKTGQLKEVLY